MPSGRRSSLGDGCRFLFRHRERHRFAALPSFSPAAEHTKHKEEPCFRLLSVCLFGFSFGGVPCPVGRAAVGLRVRPLIVQLKAIEQAHRQRGHILPEEVEKRAQIEKEAERRAALFLTPGEFLTLYGHEPKPDEKAA